MADSRPASMQSPTLVDDFYMYDEQGVAALSITRVREYCKALEQAGSESHTVQAGSQCIVLVAHHKTGTHMMRHLRDLLVRFLGLRASAARSSKKDRLDPSGMTFWCSAGGQQLALAQATAGCRIAHVVRSPSSTLGSLLSYNEGMFESHKPSDGVRYGDPFDVAWRAHNRTAMWEASFASSKFKATSRDVLQTLERTLNGDPHGDQHGSQHGRTPVSCPSGDHSPADGSADGRSHTFTLDLDADFATDFDGTLAKLVPFLLPHATPVDVCALRILAAQFDYSRFGADADPAETSSRITRSMRTSPRTDNPQEIRPQASRPQESWPQGSRPQESRPQASSTSSRPQAGGSTRRRMVTRGADHIMSNATRQSRGAGLAALVARGVPFTTNLEAQDASYRRYMSQLGGHPWCFGHTPKHPPSTPPRTLPPMPPPTPPPPLPSPPPPLKSLPPPLPLPPPPLPLPPTPLHSPPPPSPSPLPPLKSLPPLRSPSPPPPLKKLLPPPLPLPPPPSPLPLLSSPRSPPPPRTALLPTPPRLAPALDDQLARLIAQ